VLAVVVAATLVAPGSLAVDLTSARIDPVASRGIPPGAGGAVGLGGGGAITPGAVATVAPTPAAGAGQPAGAVGAPRVQAKAVVLADEATGQVLFERNAGVPRAMASTTKVMTALLTLERLDEDKVVVIGAGPPKVGEESLRLRKGERLTVRQLLLGLLVKSANDAGVALAEAVDGSEAAFVRRMNRKAAALRLRATRYVTPYGLDRPGHQTSARDLARLWEVAMRRADFRALVAARSARLPGVPLSLRRFVTTNQLLGSYRWTVGGKTGFTNRAGRCLVASASRGGRRLVVVALGSPDAFRDVRALFEYGFTKFVRVRLASRGQPVAAAAGRPPTLQAGADVDALVRLDQLERVRLSLDQATAAAGAGSGGSGGTTPGAGSAASGQGASGGGPGDAGRGWFVSGERRLVQVPLVRLGSGVSTTTVTLSPLSPPTGGAGSGPAASAGSAPGSGASPGATLVAGVVVRVWPVPRGAAAPTIDAFLRRDPP
jgi:D-alanyl-D-alanine carboxypeptidase